MEFPDARLGHIYFVQSVTGGPIKVGHSTKLESRLGALRRSCPFHLKLLGSVWGRLDEERWMHHFLAPHRSHAEWFNDTPFVRAFVDEAIASGPGFMIIVDGAPERFSSLSNAAVHWLIGECARRHDKEKVSPGRTDVTVCDAYASMVAGFCDMAKSRDMAFSVPRLLSDAAAEAAINEMYEKRERLYAMYADKPPEQEAHGCPSSST